jgi:hypothetical protein
MKVTKAFEKSQELITHAKAIEDWYALQQWDKDSKMPKDIRLNSAIKNVIDETYEEGYELYRKVVKIVDGLEIE